MARFNLKALPLISASSTRGTPAIGFPTVANYKQWYTAAKLDWTAAREDVITITGWVVTEITGVVALLSSQQLAVYARARIFDQSQNADVWAGTFTKQIFRVKGLEQYGNPREVTSFNVGPLIVGSPGILQPGRRYTMFLEVMKERVSGSPSCNVTIVDSAIWPDSAKVLRNLTPVS